MDWSGKRVLVTGGGGFIGSHLAEELVRRGARVTVLLRYNSRNHWGQLEGRYPAQGGPVTAVLGDVADGLLVRQAVTGQAVVFHLAALIGIPYSYQAPQSYLSTNIQGTLNVLEACRAAGVERLVLTSTSEVYGTARYTPIDEAHPLQGQSPYSASKIAADKLGEAYHCSFGLPVATLRPFNTYGPRQSTRAVIPTIISQALAGDEVRLGDLTPSRDLTYVTDTVAAFLRMAEAPAAIGRTINVGAGQGITIGELARRICEQVNPRARIVTDADRIRPEGSEVRQLLCDHRLAGALLDWHPTVSLTQGLQRTIAWIREHRAQFKTGMYVV